MRRLRPVAFATIAGLCALAHVPAWGEAGRTAAPFLKRTLGAQAAGMGGAFVAVRGRPDSLQYNPAALATLRSKTLTTTYLSGFGGTTHGFLGYVHPLGAGTLGAGILYFNAGSIDLNLSDGTRGTVTAEEDLAATLSYARRIGFGLSLGASYRFVRLELAETARATTSQGDFAAHWRVPGPLRGLSAGAAYQYVGPDITFEEAGDPPPKTFRYGLALHFPEIDAEKIDPSVDLSAFDMTLAADIVDTLHEEPSPRVGIELGLTPSMMSRVALRFGWVFERPAESFTLGFGVARGRLSVDYAVGASEDLGHLQQFTLTFAFDRP